MQFIARPAGRRSFALKASVLAVSCALLGACSSLGLNSDKIDYQAAKAPRSLDIPPDLSALPENDRYAVPQQGGVSASATVNAAKPAGPGNAAGADAVAPRAPNARIERAGSQRWVAVDLPPEQTYQVLKDFWASVNLGLDRDDPAAGILETVWAENRAKLPQDILRRTIGRVLEGLYDTGQRDKFRSRIERTANNTSEIYISHRGMEEVFVSSAQDRTAWQWRASDPELEAEMLQRLLLRFNQSASNASAAAASTAAAAALKAPVPQLTQLNKSADGRVSQLSISEPFDRAWRRIGLALDRGGFTVEDRDRAKGTYFVRYLDPEVEAKQRSEQGLFSRWFGRDPKIEAQQFRVLVATAGDGSQVSVLDKDGKPETSAVGSRILVLLNEQLR